MELNYYRWPLDRAAAAPQTPVELPVIKPTGDPDARGYVPHPELVEAVNVALALGMPLLLTGEPGTGKTEFARTVTFQLHFNGPFKFVAKSNSVARDLFYNYDALGRLYAAEVARLPDIPEEKRRLAEEALNFIDYAPLGRAILLGHDKGEVLEFVPPRERAGGPTVGGRLNHAGPPSRSVVLIDEIDKAPRDFTNDLLDELENMQFRVPEVRDPPTPALPRQFWPVVIITSNSERQLPEAFMRRCLYFHIPFPASSSRSGAAAAAADPNGYTIENIVAARLGPQHGQGFSDTALVKDALGFFYHLRELEPRLRKPPATAELLNWLVAMSEDGADAKQPLKAQPHHATRTIAALLKTQDDLQRGRDDLSRWLSA
jgi:MoxR-like ATPase